MANRRPLLEQQQIHRGGILAADGTVIARSTGVGKGNNKIFVRHYPQGSLFGNPIGYSFVDRGRVGFELSHNDELVGNKTEFLSILDELQGHSQVGDRVQSSLDPAAQRAAVEGLAGRRGSVVAMIPSTGEVKAMVSIPEYDPNVVQNANAFKRLNTEDSAPLFNRATQAGYPPGSTMKVVTATAALDSGQFTTSSVLSGRSPQVIDGVPLSNDGGEQFGDIDMTTALTNSVNTYWAQVGEKLGKQTMFKYMDRYGFDAKPRLDYPAFQLAPSGVYSGNRLLGPSDAIDIGRVAIGQERLRVTPLQMAEVAAAVANKGELMEPRLWSKVIDPDGRVTNLDPAHQSRVMSDGDRLRAQHDDAERGPGRNRDRCGGLGHRRGRQDRHRGDLHGDQRRLVHRLRPGERPADRDRLHRGAHQRLRRADLRADLQVGRRGDPAWELRWLVPTRAPWSTSAIGSSARSGRAGWPTSGWRRTPSWIATWRLRSSTTASRRTRSSSSASSAKLRRRPASSTRTWSASSTAGFSTTPTSSRWSTSTDRRSRIWSGAGWGRRTRSTSRARS